MSSWSCMCAVLLTLVQNAALQMWQQRACSTAPSPPPLHLRCREQRDAWLGWDVKWWLTLAVEERITRGGGGRLPCPPNVSPHCSFSCCSCSFVLRAFTYRSVVSLVSMRGLTTTMLLFTSIHIHKLVKKQHYSACRATVVIITE